MKSTVPVGGTPPVTDEATVATNLTFWPTLTFGVEETNIVTDGVTTGVMDPTCTSTAPTSTAPVANAVEPR